MANAIQANKIYIEATGSIADGRQKVVYIVFTPKAAGDSITFKESSSGPAILVLKGATAEQSLYFDFSRVPLVFTNGIYVSQLDTDCVCTVVTTSGGTT